VVSVAVGLWRWLTWLTRRYIQGDCETQTDSDWQWLSVSLTACVLDLVSRVQTVWSAFTTQSHPSSDRLHSIWLRWVHLHDLPSEYDAYNQWPWVLSELSLFCSLWVWVNSAYYSTTSYLANSEILKQYRNFLIESFIIGIEGLVGCPYLAVAVVQYSVVLVG